MDPAGHRGVAAHRGAQVGPQLPAGGEQGDRCRDATVETDEPPAPHTRAELRREHGCRALGARYRTALRRLLVAARVGIRRPDRLAATQILDQPPGDQPDDVEPEAGVLVVKLHHLVGGDRKQLDIGITNRRGGALSARREHADLAQHGPRSERLAELLEPDGAAQEVEHLAGGIATAEEDLARLGTPRRHERQQAFQGQIADRDLAYLPDQRPDLHQPPDVQRQERGVQDEKRHDAGEPGVEQERDVAADPDDPERDHGFHVERREHEPRGYIAHELQHRLLGAAASPLARCRRVEPESKHACCRGATGGRDYLEPREQGSERQRVPARACRTTGRSH